MLQRLNLNQVGLEKSNCLDPQIVCKILEPPPQRLFARNPHLCCPFANRTAKNNKIARNLHNSSPVTVTLVRVARTGQLASPWPPCAKGPGTSAEPIFPSPQPEPAISQPRTELPQAKPRAISVSFATVPLVRAARTGQLMVSCPPCPCCRRDVDTYFQYVCVCAAADVTPRRTTLLTEAGLHASFKNTFSESPLPPFSNQITRQTCAGRH